jgi:prepilin-type processing-associated H-X9-DG protein
MMTFARKHKWILAFSMTEILAVSAIVTSIPAAQYARAKQKAYETKCRSNLQQIGQMVTMFQMSEGVYPKAVFYPADAFKDSNSIVKIMEDAGYRVPREMWICPSAPEDLAKRGLTFVYNESIGGKSSVPRPNKTWLLIEINCVSKRVSEPHPGGYNVLLADGTVITTKILPPDLRKLQQAAIRKAIEHAAETHGQG